jgi:hypothetical protein
MRIRSILLIGLLFLAIFVAIGIVLVTQHPVAAQSDFATSDNYTRVIKAFSVDQQSPGHKIPQGSIIRHLNGGTTEIAGPDNRIIVRAKDSDAELVNTASGQIRATHICQIPDKSVIMTKDNIIKVYSGGNLILTIINQEQHAPATPGDSWIEWVSTIQSTSVDYYAADWTVPKTPVHDSIENAGNAHIFNGIFNGIQQGEVPKIIQPVLSWNVEPYRVDQSGGWSGRAVYWTPDQGQQLVATPFEANEGDLISGVMHYSNGFWIVNISDLTRGVTSSFYTNAFGTANNLVCATLEAYNSDVDEDIPGTIQFTDMQVTYNSNPITKDWYKDNNADLYNFSHLYQDIDFPPNPTTCTLYTNGGHMTVETGSATNIGSTSATLHGDLTYFGPDSLRDGLPDPSAQVSFDYGTDPNLDTHTSTPPQTRTETGSFQQAVTNLNPGTQYYYRAKAVGTQAGTVYGDIRSFATLGPPPPPPPPSLDITTTSLPNGTVGVAYWQTLQATGGTGNYTWSIVEGPAALPPGLSLAPSTGVISGTPSHCPLPSTSRHRWPSPPLLSLAALSAPSTPRRLQPPEGPAATAGPSLAARCQPG